MKKRSASATRAFTRSVKRDKIDGRPKRGGTAAGRSRDVSIAVLKRLRRVELAVVSLITPGRRFDLDSFVKSVIQLETDARDDQGRSVDEGSQIPVSQKGTPAGEGS